MIKSRLTLTLLGACAVLAAAWPFRYQLYLHLPSEPVHRLVVKDGLYWLKGKVYSGRITETDVLKGGGLITITPVIDGVREGRSVTFDDGEPVATAEWVAGKLEGPAVRTSRRTGRVLEEAFYKDGRLDGETQALWRRRHPAQKRNPCGRRARRDGEGVRARRHEAS